MLGDFNISQEETGFPLDDANIIRWIATLSWTRVYNS